MGTPTKVQDNKKKCSKCNEDHPVRKITKDGDPVGSGSTLGRRLERKKSPLNYVMKIWSKAKGKHYSAGSLQAHHLVMSCTCNKNDEWTEIVRKYGYDINHKKNGVLLPGFMDLACLLAMPVHNTNHDAGETVHGSPEPSLRYPAVVYARSAEVLDQFIGIEICEYSDALINQLNSLSQEIRENILSFAWTISSDGLDYVGGNSIGCGNVPPNINSYLAKEGNCKCKRNHIIAEFEAVKKKIEQLTK